jgi:hypothetical protein
MFQVYATYDREFDISFIWFNLFIVNNIENYSLRGEVWAHTISLNRTLFIEVYVPGQESEGSWIYVLGYRFCLCIYESWDRISSMVKCMVNILATQCTIVLIRKNIGSIKFISGSAASPDMNFIDPIFSV